MFLFSHDWSSSGYLHSEAICDDLRSIPDLPDGAIRGEDTLSELELRVIGISLQDCPVENKEPSRFVRLKRWIFGDFPPNRLANERLEALRRYCIQVRIFGGVFSTEERSLALAHGFSDSLLDEAASLVATKQR